MKISKMMRGTLRSTFFTSQVEIDWGTGDDGQDVDTSTIVVEEGGVAGGVARDSEALSLLDNRRTRTLILDELEELRCFLEQRLVEAAAAEDGAVGFSAVAAETGELDAAGLRQFSARTAALMGRLNAGRIHHLQLIRSSPKYVDRLVDSLRQKLALEGRMKAANDTLADRKDKAISEQVGAGVQKPSL